MKKFTTFASLAMVLVFALSATAGEIDKERRYLWSDADAAAMMSGDNFSKAEGETIMLVGPVGSGANYEIGDFEAVNTSKTLTPAAPLDWSSNDETQPTETHFKIDSYMQTGGDLAAWCGELFDRCTDRDSIGGYGNNWRDVIEYRIPVDRVDQSTTITITGEIQVWTEPGYDYVYTSCRYGGVPGWTNDEIWDGPIYNDDGPVPVNSTFTYVPGQYLDGTDIGVYFRFSSDTGWSDEDCAHTSSNTAGACQIDDVTVVVTNGTTEIANDFDDFEGGTWESTAWEPIIPQGCGDFAHIWEALEDVDLCSTNYTRQVAFIDDGLVVPGTGGTECITWCYGPGGYVVNHTGGLAAGDEHVHCYATSPVMDWPDPSHDGMIFWFNVYRHEPESATSTGVYYRFRARTVDTTDPETPSIEDATWWSGGNWYGGPDYNRHGTNFTSVIVPARNQIQIQVGCYELGWAWGIIGNDGMPSPYFDHIQILTFPVTGPAFAFSEGALAQDNFPTIGEIDTADLSRNGVRFDMAWNISPTVDLRNDPGDSISITCSPARTGAGLIEPPTMHYTILCNSIFDGERPYTPTDGVYVGELLGITDGPDSYYFDFDEGDDGDLGPAMLWPGDRIHYYFAGQDTIYGDMGTLQGNTLPADLDGYGDFTSPIAYDLRFQMSCLPTVKSIDTELGTHTQPTVLFWNDFGWRNGWDEWFGSLMALGLVQGDDYDVYHTNRPDNGAGNGLGGRAEIGDVEGYLTMLYTAGDLGASTISNGDYAADPSNDIALLDLWLASEGGRDMLITGDEVVHDLAVNMGTTGLAFVENRMGLTFDTYRIIDDIGGQATPLVVAETGNPVFSQATSWIAYGGCFGINDFDGVLANAGAERLAQFTDTNRNTGAYEFSAATLYNDSGTGSRIISIPYDLIYIHDDASAKVAAPKPMRTLVLSDVLNYFSVPNDPGNTVNAETPGMAFSVSQNSPNPFNPMTKIAYVMDKKGHMTMKVFNVRGHHVATLIDGTVDAGAGEVIWDGTNSQGARVSSGVYFYEVRTDRDVYVNKMTVVK